MIKHILLLFICLMAIARSEAVAADSVSTANPEKSHPVLQQPLTDFGPGYWLGYLADSRDIFTGFLHWHAGEWIAAGLIAGTTAGLFVFDDEIQAIIQRNRTDVTDRASKIAKPLGDGRIALGAMAGGYLLGWGLNDARLRNSARYGIESYIISGIITTILKYSLHRHRPSAHDGPYRWDGPGFNGDNESFPSGHSTTAFAIAGSIAGQYPDNWLVGGLSYSIAALVALSRLNDNNHWASDAFVGSTIGWVTARTVALAHRGKSGSSVEIRPAMIDENPGMVLEWRF